MVIGDIIKKAIDKIIGSLVHVVGVGTLGVIIYLITRGNCNPLQVLTAVSCGVTAIAILTVLGTINIRRPN